MRYELHMIFQAETGPRRAGRAFRRRKRHCTLIVLRVPGQETPWILLTDESPDDAELDAQGTGVGIEQGFRSLKRMGRQ